MLPKTERLALPLDGAESAACAVSLLSHYVSLAGLQHLLSLRVHLLSLRVHSRSSLL